MRWPDGVGVGARVVASTQMGFWLRGVVRELDASGARVDFQASGGADWMPRLMGFGAPAETVTPERIARLPEAPPSVLPPLGSPVIVLWNGKRFHPATLVARAHASEGVVRYDEGDEEPVAPRDLLVRGVADESAASALRERGFVPGAAVRVTSSGHSGWVSEVGSRLVYVRYPKASHGHWCEPRELALGGSAKPPEAPRSIAEPAPGARVSARWLDRVRYPGTVRAARSEVSQLEIVWDDGSVEWVPSRRVVVTAAAPPEVPQARAVEPLDVRAWASGQRVLVRLPSADWADGRVEAVRGDDVYVGHGPGHRRRVWARGKDLAAPPLDGRFPARSTAVVLEERARPNGPATHRSGRVGDALGGRVEVRIDEGGTTMAGPEGLWRRVPNPAAPSAVPSGVTVGARVLVEHRPDDLVRARVVKLRAPEGLARVEFESGKGTTLDLARVRFVAEPPAPPPPPPPEPPVVEAATPPSADERARRIAKLVALEWSSGGYRASVGEGGRAALEVEVGELTLDVRIEQDLFVVEIVAADAVPGAPPIEGTAVRLARFFRGLLGGRAEGSDAIEVADRAWLVALGRRGIRRKVVRAGGALSVVFRMEQEPSVSDVIRWARAVHARLFDPAPS